MIYRFLSWIHLVNMIAREDTRLSEPQALTLVPSIHTNLADGIELSFLKKKNCIINVIMNISLP